MSLIDEALRRVQDPITAKEPPGIQTPAAQSPAKTAPAPKKSEDKAHSWTIPAVQSNPARKTAATQTDRRFLILLTASLITAVCVLWIASLFLFKPGFKTQARAIKPAVSRGKQQASPPLNDSSASGASAESRFKVTGVVIGSGETYAVIDGRIVAKGELIEEATVLEIQESGVTLQLSDGTQTVVRVPR